ncbi:MAG: GNAT family N-acetyltransferase [Gemmatimonadaceae bacterium]|nr:GNAT family N-acetyltransferase [Gloeobacterales cyanobacterium ES-bin-141]
MLTALRNDIDLQALLLAVPKPNTEQRTRDWLNRRLDDPQGVFFIICDRSSNRGVGFIQVVHIELLHRRGELGLCIEPSEQGKGYATAALGLIERYLQDVFDLRKLTLNVLASNENAIGFYRGINYSTVGTLKQHFYYKQTFHDVLVMEKLFFAADVSR